jgi:hypothetical protein
MDRAIREAVSRMEDVCVGFWFELGAWPVAISLFAIGMIAGQIG